MVYGRFDSKIRFENELDSWFDLRFDLNEKTIRRSLDLAVIFVVLHQRSSDQIRS